jgi:DNA-3-methyladenine glycosylase I
MCAAIVTKKRCSWVSVDDPLLLQYHDHEWGVPVHNDRKHFEVLVLSCVQAGLSWSIVLKKREGYRRAFNKFDPEKVARYSERQIRKLTTDPEIIRNRMKIEAAVRNAGAFLKIREEFGTFDSYCWRSLTDGQGLTDGRLRGRFQRYRPNPRHSARTSSAGDSTLSARRSFMPTCSRLEW